MDILISGSSTGIGRAAAIHMARLGHTVWAGVRTQKSFDDVTKLNVKGLQPVFLDVCDEKSIVACVSTIKKNSGMLHALVNNAGIAVGGPIEAVSLADWRRQFETNLFGQVRVTQECLPLLRESKGRIVNISSISGKVVSPFMGPYAASKFALEAVSDALRRELRAHGVKVSIVEPGPIATPIWEKAKNDGIPRIDAYGPQIKHVYGPMMAKFKERLEDVIRRADPAHLTTKAIEHALTSTRPRIRYPVGRGIKAGIALASALPDSWMDKLVVR
jgi:NAD(P)-dependent dehydrogenase (short-subunit alcohol dehydrogenase family)